MFHQTILSLVEAGVLLAAGAFASNLGFLEKIDAQVRNSACTDLVHSSRKDRLCPPHLVRRQLNCCVSDSWGSNLPHLLHCQLWHSKFCQCRE